VESVVQGSDEMSLLGLMECFTLVASSHANLWKKRKYCIRKELNSHRIGLVHQHGRLFIVFGHEYGCCGVMQKRSIQEGWQTS